MDDEHTIAELARVFNDRDEAVLLAKRAGFPAEGIPNFRTARVFWAKVVEEARNGALRGGVRSILEKASETHPANEIFARVAPSIPEGAGPGKRMPSSDSATPRIAISPVPIVGETILKTNEAAQDKGWVCKNCGHVGSVDRLHNEKEQKALSVFLLIALGGLAATVQGYWKGLIALAFGVGMYYGTHINGKPVCRSCKGLDMVPADSPVGLAILEAGRKDRGM